MSDGTRLTGSIAPIIVASMLLLTWLTPGATMPGVGESTDMFGDGETTALITFGDGGGEDNDTKLTLPAGTNVSGATFTISTAPSAAGDYPSVVSVDVGADGDLEWQFASTGMGRFGLQERLSNSAAAGRAIITGGGNDTLHIRLPKTATVTNASLNLTGHWNGIVNGDFESGTTGWLELDYWGRGTMTTSSARGGSYPGTGWGANNNYLLVHSNPLGANQNRCYVEVISLPFKHQFGDYVTMSWDMVEVDTYYVTIYAGDTDGGWSYIKHVGAANPNQDNNVNHYENATAVTYDISGLGDADRFIEFMVYCAWNNDGDWGRVAADDIYLSYSDGTPIPEWPNDVGLDLGADGVEEWSLPGLMQTEQHIGGLESTLNDLLASMPVTGKDVYGNAYVDIPINLTSPDIAEVGVEDIRIEYEYTATVKKKPGGGNLTTEVNEYMTSPHEGSGAGSSISVPVIVSSESKGQVELGDLLLVYNGAPQFAPLPDLEVDEDVSSPSLLDLSSYVTDDDDAFGDLSFDLIKVSKFGKVRLSVTDGVVGVDLSRAGNYHTAPGEPLVFRLLATDTMGLQRESPDISLYIRPVNDEPELFQQVINLTMEEDSSPLKLDLMLGEYFRDPDGDPLHFAAVVDMEDAVEGENLTASVSSSGILKLTPGADYFGDLIPVHVFADDGDDGDAADDPTVNATLAGGSAFQVLYVNITAVNDPPVWGPLENLTLEDGERAEDHLTLTDAITDVDTPPDSLEFSEPIVSDVSILTAQLDPEGHLDISAGDGVEGTATITLQVVDGEHLVTTGFSVSVVLRNTAPVTVDPPAHVYVDEDGTLPDAVDLVRNFYDQDGDPLAYTVTGGSDNVLHSLDAEAGLVSFTPAPDWNGEALFTFTAHDPMGLNASFNTTVVVVPVNDAPTVPKIRSPDDGAVVGGEEVTFLTDGATDVDGDELEYIWDFDVTDDVEGTVRGMNATHAFTADGLYTVKLTVTDGTAEVSTSISVSVEGVSRTPQGGDGGSSAEEKSSDAEAASMLTILLLVVVIVLVIVFLLTFKRKKDTDHEIERARATATVTISAGMPAPGVTLGGLGGTPALPGSSGQGADGAGPVLDPSLLLPSQDGEGGALGAGDAGTRNGHAGAGAPVPTGGAPEVLDGELVTEPSPGWTGGADQGFGGTGPKAPPEDRDITGIPDEEAQAGGPDTGIEPAGPDPAAGTGTAAAGAARPRPRPGAGSRTKLRGKPPSRPKTGARGGKAAGGATGPAGDGGPDEEGPATGKGAGGEDGGKRPGAKKGGAGRTSGLGTLPG